MKPKTVAVNSYMQHAAISPDGKKSIGKPGAKSFLCLLKMAM